MNDKKSKLSLNDLECHLWEAAHIITGRLLKLKGQEKNLTTKAITRMNLYLHGMEDFEIRRGLF